MARDDQKRRRRGDVSGAGSRSVAADARAAHGGAAVAVAVGPAAARGDRPALVPVSGHAAEPVVSLMKTHPFLRAYMAGIVVPTVALLFGATAFVIARYVYNVPIPIERVIMFPMAVVPNLWGVWNMLPLAIGGARRWPIGAHGALLPLILIPLGWLLARVFAIDAITPPLVAVFAPLAMAVYYLAWKHLVGYFNAVLGIA